MGGDWNHLWDYVRGTVSKPQSTLWSVQALWQEGVNAWTDWPSYNILKFNEQSDINKQVLDRIELFASANLLEMNNVCLHGTEIAEKLGTKVTDADKQACASACRDRQYGPSCIAPGADCCGPFDFACCGDCIDDQQACKSHGAGNFGMRSCHQCGPGGFTLGGCAKYG